MSQSNERKTENIRTFLKTKKRKFDEENRRFQDKWMLLYAVTSVKENVHGLICLHPVAAIKEYNIKMHMLSN